MQVPVTRTSRRTRARLVGVVVGAVALLAGAAGPAAAHNSLVSTFPTADQSVARTPEQVVLTFDEPAIALGTQVVVTGPAGPAQVGAPTLVDSTVSQSLAPGAPAGTYTVSWRVTSTDGHPISGSYVFTSLAPAASTSTAVPSPAAGPPALPTDQPDQVPLGLGLTVGVVLLVGVGLILWRRQRPSPLDDDTSQE